MTTENIKEELNKDMENLRKKNQTAILEIRCPVSPTKNTEEGHSSRLVQMEDRILELKDKNKKLKEKTEEILVKQLKSCERNMQKLSNFIKRPNCSIMGIEEREEVQSKGI
jgi:hypothetical protein